MNNKEISELRRKILSFMEMKKESDHWDFKQEWSEEIKDVVKDIICFSNTAHDEDCYLIYGISDDHKITGMEKERKKQADILDAMAKIIFAGGVAPEIELETIMLQNKEVDVLIIKNVERTPIYLERPHDKFRVGYIYSRDKDRNTAIDENSRPETIEKLWKKRFGLLKAPLDYMLDELENVNNWEINDEGYYYKYNPDYKIKEVENNENYRNIVEFYSYSVTNESSLYYTYEFFYKSSLKKYKIVVLDGGRFPTAVPEREVLKIEEEKIYYGYYVKGRALWKVKEFFYNKSENPEKEDAKQDFENVILIFESEKEKEEFNYYLAEKFEGFKIRLNENAEYDYIETNDNIRTQFYKEQLRIGLTLNEMLNEFRSEKLNDETR